MVDGSEIYQSDEWITLDRVKSSKNKVAIIVTEGEIQESTIDNRTWKQIVLDVEMDKIPYKWGINKTSWQNCNDEWGNDTINWVGKRVKFQLMKIKGRESVVAIPLDNDNYPLDYHGVKLE